MATAMLRKSAVAPARASRTAVKPAASLNKVAQAAGIAVAGFSLALGAQAATVKLGADSGEFCLRCAASHSILQLTKLTATNAS